MPRHWRSLIDKDFMGAWDLVDKTGKPKDYTLAIAKVESKLLKTKEQPKGRRRCTITFHKAQKQFVANSTNCETIAGMYGNDVDAWVGKLVTLYQTTTRDPKNPRGPEVPCIRVRPRKPTGQAEEIEAQPVDEAMRDAQDKAFGREPGEEG